jgi:two-component system LytT family response regulator
MTFTVLVADDEPLARQMIADILRDVRDIADVVTCENAAAVRAVLAERPVEIAFLDVEMPEMNGMELAGQFEPEMPVVVFFSEYARQAFDVRAVDYVLKPFSDERLIEALNRAKERVCDHRRRQSAIELPEEPLHGWLDRLAFKDRDRSIVLKTSEILWIEAQDYYAQVHSPHGRFLLRTTLASLIARLDPKRFLRVHRGAIINVDEVRSLGGRGQLHLTLSDGSVVPVSRARRRSVLKALRPRLRSV